MWNWFLGNGDKLLLGLTGVLQALAQTGVLHASPWLSAITAVAAVLHTTVLPEPTPTTPPAK